MIRRSGKPVVLVVNKVDNSGTMMTDVYEFYNLGLRDPMPISGLIPSFDLVLCWTKSSSILNRVQQKT